MRQFFFLLLSVFLFFSCATGGRINYVSPADYFELADGYAGISKYDKALFFYSKTRNAPEYKNAAEYGMARMYAFLGKWNEAVPLLTNLRQRDSKNLLVTSALAYAHAANGNPEQALILYKEIYENNADDPETALSYARILLLCENYQDLLDLTSSLHVKFPNSSILQPLITLENKASEALTPLKIVDITEIIED